MNVLRSFEDLSANLGTTKCQPGCFADTGFLYAATIDDDRLFETAIDVYNLLFEYEIPLYANVISRMEFIDLIFRKHVTNACITLFDKLKRDPHNQPLYNLLKNIRDKDTEAKRLKESFKIGEGQLKNLRALIEQATEVVGWKGFCNTYVGSMLVNEWKLVEEELGLNFIEVLESGTSALMNKPLLWKDMVQIMGTQGVRGPDAMILNLFFKSKFPLLITTDSDFETCINSISENSSEKTILILS